VTKLVRQLLIVDAAIEAVLGIILLGVVGRPHFWLNVDRAVTIWAGVVFLLAAVIIAVAAGSRRTSAEFVQYLAFANVVGGLAIWVGTVLRWDRFEDEGLWLIAASADAFILIGVLELIALRKR
jgi:hypothetical protein